MAQATRLSVSHLSRLENDSGIPNPETVVKLAEALGGELGYMLELSNTLPRQILDRLSRRASGATESLRRTAGSEPQNQTFIREFVEDIPPELRADVAKAFTLSDQDVNGIFAALQRLGRMDPSDRDSILKALTLMTREVG